VAFVFVGQETSANFGGNFNVAFTKRLAFATPHSLVIPGFKLKAYLAAFNYLFMDARGSVNTKNLVLLGSHFLDAMEFAVAGRDFPDDLPPVV